MKYRELREVVEGSTCDAAPEDTYEIDVSVDCGPFPSGEEGAEDWIMGSSITKVDVDHAKREVYIEVNYS